MASTSLCLASVLLGGLYLVLERRKRHPRARLPLPPSPTSYPIIGNVLSMPKEYEHEGFLELGRNLGSDIISLSFFGVTIIVLNSAKAANDLLEKRSAIYSDRIAFPALGDTRLMNWSTNVSSDGYTNMFKKHRRMMHMWLNKQVVATFHPSQQRQTRCLLQRLMSKEGELVTSEHLSKELSITMASTLLHSTYGYDLQSPDDPFLLEPRVLLDNMVRAVTPSCFRVNLFPALANLPDWLPGMEWKKTLRGWGEHKDKILADLVNWTKAQMTAGVNEPSIVASFVGEIDKWGHTESEAWSSIQEVGIGLLGGGTDTGVGSLMVFIIAMLLFPNIQKKAQDEIDAVIGTDRLPTVEDQPNLPYIQRLMLECARWRPVLPLAIPHKCMEDNEYRGYFLPQNAIVFGNIWAMTRDANVYPNPEVFDPDRFLDPSVPPAPVFGWGRRICPGSHYSESSQFIAISSILAAFNITPAKDDSGSPTLPSIKPENTVTFRPLPFKCRFTPRSGLYTELVRNGV